MDPQQLIRTVQQELNLTHLPTNMQNDIVEKLGENILERIILEMLKRVPANHQDEFGDVGKTGDHEKIIAFAKMHIPDFEEFVQHVTADEVSEFKKMANIH